MSKIEQQGWYCNCPDCEVDMFVTNLGEVKEQIDYCPHDLLVLPSYSQGVIDTLTSELEAERKAKEEAIERLRYILLDHIDANYDYTSSKNLPVCAYGHFDPIRRGKATTCVGCISISLANDFLKTHGVSKGEK